MSALPAAMTASSPWPAAPPVAEHAATEAPSDLACSWQLADGWPVQMRPVLPGDRAALERFVNDLSRASRLARFPGLMRALTPSQLAELTEVDFDHHVGYVVAVPHEAGERVIGEARFMVDGNTGSAGIALVVADAWHRRGIGARVLLAMAGAATRRGLRWLRADVPHDNRAMLGLLRHCGFSAAPHPDEAELAQLHLLLPALRS